MSLLMIFWVLAFAPLTLFLPGYFFLKLIWGETQKLSSWEGFLLSIGLSFLLSYPFGVLNTVIEVFRGQGPIQMHAGTLLPLYGIFNLVLFCSLMR